VTVPARPARPAAPASAAVRAVFPAAFLAAFLAAGCAAGPRAGSEAAPDAGMDAALEATATAQAVRVGTRYFGYARQAEGGDWNGDPALVAEVARVGAAVAARGPRPDLPWEFVVVDRSAPDAWSLPGGKVAVTRGLLARLSSEAELAAVLAEQIVHASETGEARRAVREIRLRLGPAGVRTRDEGTRDHPEVVVDEGRFGGVLPQRQYGADDEIQADRVALPALAAAGYDPGAAVRLQERMLAPGDDATAWAGGLLANHPVTARRLEAARRVVADLPAGGTVGEDAYREAAAGLTAALPAYAEAGTGAEALADGDPEGAVERARAARALAPGVAEFDLLEARAELAAGRRDEAEAALDRALERAPDRYLPRLLRGLARKERGDAAGAREDLARSLELLPTVRAHLALGELEMDAGEVESAKYHLRRAASGGGAVGREAAATLTRVEIGEVPGRYVAVGAGLRGDGKVFVVIHNRSPLPLQDVRVEVRLAATDSDPEGPEQVTELSFPGPFAARARVERDTAFGPFPPEAATRLRTRVLGAALAE